MTPRFSPGDMVQSVADPTRVGAVLEMRELHAGIQWYRVMFGTVVTMAAETDLRPFLAVSSPIDNLVAGNFGGYKEFQRLITLQRLLRDYPLQNNIYAFNASRTRFYPYQFKPLLKFLDSPKHRLLLADEVGLGKTIEAGLILTELRARQEVMRVLVVCPANLTKKWQWELKLRFAEKFEVYNAAGLREFLEEYERSPERTPLQGIISLEGIRTEKLIGRLEEASVDFDLVIVDEAHHMRNFGRKQRKVGEVLSRTAKAMILLTATPIHLGNENLHSLLNILDEDEFPDFYTLDKRIRSNEPIVKAQICMGRNLPDAAQAEALVQEAGQSVWIQENPLLPETLDKLARLKQLPGDEQQARRRLVIDIQRDLSELNLLAHVFTRTRKREVHENVAQRRAISIRVNLTPLEEQFYTAVTAYVRELSLDATGSSLIQQWILHMPQRRMASCIPAMVEYYRKSLAFDPADVSEDDFLEEEQNQSGNRGAQGFSEARQHLQTIIANWPAAGPDAKYDALLEKLRLMRKDGPIKAIIFSFFKDTLRYLHNRLTQEGIKCSMIHGEVAIPERLQKIERFKKNPQIEILLSSRVGSEGLDLQFCDTLFNYDLPWNPMEVEQRIGRLDRIGQASDVIKILNFWVEGTIEQRILDRLYSRIKIFERSIGDLEMILGEEVRNLERDLLSRSLTPQEEANRIEQAARVIEARILELEKLEGEAATFIGTDLFFDEEVNKIRQHRRYVTGLQIKNFLEDFLKQDCPRTRFIYDAKTQLGELHPDEKLRTFIANQQIGAELPQFFGSGEIPVTLDSQVAFERPEIEFIHVLHPLVQAITKYYNADRNTRIPSNSNYLILKIDKLQAGLYLYFIYKLRVIAAKERNLLEMITLDENLLPVAMAEDAEGILGEMVERGQEPNSLEVELDPTWSREACQKAQELLFERIAQVEKEVKRTNDAFIDRRLNSLRIFYNRILTRLKDLLESGEARGASEIYLRMLRGQIKRRENELATAENSWEMKRNVSVQYDDVAAGILEVVK